MVEDLQNLIEKINQEGIKAAEDKAKEIEHGAKRRAEEIVEKAKKEAEKVIAQARNDVDKMVKSGEESLKQAGRNLIISLRQEIASTLEKIIKLQIRDELSPDEMAGIITTLIKDYNNRDKKNIIITLSKEDLGKMEKVFLARLRDEVKRGVTLKQSDEIQAGFIISYDDGKSHYDFTDKALAEYASQYLKPKLGELLRGTDSSDAKKS